MVPKSASAFTQLLSVCMVASEAGVYGTRREKLAVSSSLDQERLLMS